DKTAEQREGGNGGCADNTENGGFGHGFVQPAQFRAVDAPGDMEHRAHGHEQQTFENHIIKGVGDSAVNGQGCAYAYAHHHKAELVDEAVGENPAQVVFDHREENRKAGHGGADVNQQLRSGITPRQGVNRHLGGKGAEKYRAGGGGFRVGVRQPVMQKRKPALDAKSDKNQPAVNACKANLVKGEGVAAVAVGNNPRQQQQAGQ